MEGEGGVWWWWVERWGASRQPATNQPAGLGRVACLKHQLVLLVLLAGPACLLTACLLTACLLTDALAALPPLLVGAGGGGARG